MEHASTRARHASIRPCCSTYVGSSCMFLCTVIVTSNGPSPAKFPTMIVPYGGDRSGVGSRTTTLLCELQHIPDIARSIWESVARQKESGKCHVCKALSGHSDELSRPWHRGKASGLARRQPTWNQPVRMIEMFSRRRDYGSRKRVCNTCRIHHYWRSSMAGPYCCNHSRPREPHSAITTWMLPGGFLMYRASNATMIAVPVTTAGRRYRTAKRRAVCI